MNRLREKCEYKDRCGRTGHYYESGIWKRCPCLILEINKQKLGEMYCERPRTDTPIIGKIDQNLKFEGPLTSIRPHIAGVLLNLSRHGS